jgi:hypothetical protein
VKLYAYQQQTLPGMRQVTIDESGITKEPPPKITASNFIYLETSSTRKIDPKHVWINGKLFDVKTADPSLPVVIYNNSIPGKKADTLVRATGKKVIQLIPSPANETFNPTAKAKRKIKSNQLVLHTIENGKNCYYYVEHIKILDPVALQ